MPIDWWGRAAQHGRAEGRVEIFNLWVGIAVRPITAVTHTSCAAVLYRRLKADRDPMHMGRRPSDQQPGALDGGALRGSSTPTLRSCPDQAIMHM